MKRVILQKGDHVVATARKSSGLKFDGTSDKNFLAQDLDVTSKDSIDKAFAAAIEKFGRIDVVCNNAGYGLSGEFESLSEKQIRTQMEGGSILIPFLWGNADNQSQLLWSDRRYTEGYVYHERAVSQGRYYSANYLYWWTNWCSHLQHLLCKSSAMLM